MEQIPGGGQCADIALGAALAVQYPGARAAGKNAGSGKPRAGACPSRGDGFCSSPAQVFRWYQSLGLEMREVYGMTENFGYPAHATASHQSLDCR